MASAFSSPNSSPLGAFIQSPLLARDAGPGGVATIIIVVGNGNGGPGSSKIMGSNDGVNWINQPNYPVFAGALTSCAFSPTLGSGLGRFCAVGGTAGGVIVTSDDGGITWLNRSRGADPNWLSVTWSSGQSQFVITGNSATINSHDGITWSNGAIGAGIWTCVKYNQDLDGFGPAYVAIDISHPASATSVDGVNFTYHGTAFNDPFLGGFQPIGGSDCANCAQGGIDGGVVVCTTNTYVMYSLNGGVTFETPQDGSHTPISILNGWFGVTWANIASTVPTGQWVAVGAHEFGVRPITEWNALGSTGAWTGNAEPAGTDDWYAITSSAALNRLISVGIGTFGQIMTGAVNTPFNNIVWAMQTSAPNSGQWQHVCASR